jgi:DNA-binding XRE family transcriptional regulator
MKRQRPDQQSPLDADVAECLELLGLFLNDRRNELGMSQGEVAEGAEVSRTEMYYIEHGLTDEKISTLLRVSRTLRMSLGEAVTHVEHLIDHPEHRPVKGVLKSQRGKNTRRSLH